MLQCCVKDPNLIIVFGSNLKKISLKKTDFAVIPKSDESVNYWVSYEYFFGDQIVFARKKIQNMTVNKNT